ncbi:MAG: GNAT family N-acetyltransferase [Gemmatimonadota bacterium]
MSFSIRPAVPDDLDRIVLFNQALARETEGRELERGILQKGVNKLLRDPDLGRYFVAEDGDEVVGQIAVTTEWSDWRNGPVWWIQSVYVSRQRRGEGIYRALHEFVREMARAEKAAGLRLYVERDNAVAQHTYLSLGMRESDYRMYEEIWS